MLLHRKLVCTDIKVSSNIKYNVGDLLCAPFYWCSWQSGEYHVKRYADHIEKIKTALPNSIIAKYYTNHSEKDFVPNYERLRTIVATYKNSCLNEVRQIVSLPMTLTVHIRSGDKGIMSDQFCTAICTLGKRFAHIVLCVGIHNETVWAPIDTSIKNLVVSVNKIFEKAKKISCYLDEPDAHLYVMMYASNLLVHRGGFSLIASLITYGTLYVTNEAEFKNNGDWKKAVAGKTVHFVK